MKNPRGGGESAATSIFFEWSTSPRAAAYGCVGSMSLWVSTTSSKSSQRGLHASRCQRRRRRRRRRRKTRRRKRRRPTQSGQPQRQAGQQQRGHREGQAVRRGSVGPQERVHPRVQPCYVRTPPSEGAREGGGGGGRGGCAARQHHHRNVPAHGPNDVAHAGQPLRRLVVERHAVGAPADDLVEAADEHVLGPRQPTAGELHGPAPVVGRGGDVHDAPLGVAFAKKKGVGGGSSWGVFRAVAFNGGRSGSGPARHGETLLPASAAGQSGPG